MLNDAHCHFFSTGFFESLGKQRHPNVGAHDLCTELGWSTPGQPEQLADRWVQELDDHGVARMALMASVPGDESSVSIAVARHPSRFVGFFMLNPGQTESAKVARHAVRNLHLRTICLFPAMHHVPLDDSRTNRILEVAGAESARVFVHCGALSVGVRKKLGLPSPFDLRLGNPLALSALAARFPEVPFIIPHFGAGLLREALMAAEACPNIYLDTSSSNRWMHYSPGLTLDAVFAAALKVIGPTRLLFGTDSSFFPRGWQDSVYQEQRDSLTRLGVTGENQTAIFTGNFNRLFP